MVYLVVEWEYYDRFDAKSITWLKKMWQDRKEQTDPGLRPSVYEMIGAIFETVPAWSWGRITGADLDIRAKWTEVPGVRCCEF